jgi:addiction module HigA family antidote
MPPVAHPGRLLKRELAARRLSANHLALDLGVPSGRITDILNGRRSISADTALRLGRYFGHRHSSGSTSRASTTSRWSSVSAARRPRSASARPTQLDRMISPTVA